MKLLMFCIKDRAVDAFGNPMFMMSAGQAIRSFGDEVNRVAVDNMMYHHPDDYDLYSLGSFDTSSGVFESTPPEQIAIGKQLKVVVQS